MTDTAAHERRLNSGLQYLPSGLRIHPVPKDPTFHRSIGQDLPELWSDFSERSFSDVLRARPERANSSVGFSKMARKGSCYRSSEASNFSEHGSLDRSPFSTAAGMTVSKGSFDRAKQKCLYVGFVEWDMDGRAHTQGEMDRLMAHAASSKYPCSRPATLDEYVEERIVGIPLRNETGRDVTFIGRGSTHQHLGNTNTLGAQKCVVAPGDELDGTCGMSAVHGRKCALCVYPVDRLKKQQSLTQFGLARCAATGDGCLRRSSSLASLQDATRWTSSDFASSLCAASRGGSARLIGMGHR